MTTAITRSGRAPNLTPEEAEVSLAAPVAHVLWHTAYVEFPGSDNAAPSRTVWIRKMAGRPYLRDGDRYKMPIAVNYRQYERAVKPVLTDERWQKDKNLNLALLRRPPNGVDEFIALIGKALKQSFIEAGYGPAET